MEYTEFEKLLREAKLSKKKFAELVGMNNGSVSNWKKNDNVPIWVNSWLKFYIEAEKCVDIGDDIKINKTEYQELIQLKQIIRNIAS
jgi:transcriptional regulator with XRE-family HTH domain